MEAVRTLVYAFREYPWASDNSTSTILVRVWNEAFDQELARSTSLRMLSLRPTFVTQAESSYVEEHGEAPPLALQP